MENYRRLGRRAGTARSNWGVVGSEVMVVQNLVIMGQIGRSRLGLEGQDRGGGIR